MLPPFVRIELPAIVPMLPNNRGPGPEVVMIEARGPRETLHDGADRARQDSVAQTDPVRGLP